MTCPHCGWASDGPGMYCDRCGAILSASSRRKAVKAQLPSPEGGRVSPGQPIRVRRAPQRPEAQPTQRRRVPIRKHSTHWGMVLGLVGLLVLALGIGAFVMLTRTETGQLQLAAWGYPVSEQAKWKLGESYMRDGYIVQALEVFEQTIQADPDNIEGRMLLANAYERDGREAQAVAIYEQTMKDHPEYPESYSRMIRMYQDKEDHDRAIATMELAYEKTKQEQFVTKLKAYMPDPPTADPIGMRYPDVTDVTLTTLNNMEIRYTLNGDDPVKDGIVYTQPIRLEEGSHTLRAVTIQQNGVSSKELSETYTIRYPTPDSPRANVKPGSYDYAPKVSLFGSADTAAIYYTMDDTEATEHATRFNPEQPIILPPGKTRLRAIAVNTRGDVSYEKIISYEVTLPVKKYFRKEDIFKNLTLMKTTYEQFVKAYGEPSQTNTLDSGNTDVLTEAAYGFGYARFIQVGGEGKRLLYELSLETEKITAPRKTKVGSSRSEVIAAFRDKGSMPNEKGERVLYQDGASIGVVKLDERGELAVHYYCERGDNDYLELSYYFQGNTVSRIVWMRYVGDI